MTVRDDDFRELQRDVTELGRTLAQHETILQRLMQDAANYVTRVEFEPFKRLLYTTVGLILSSVLGMALFRMGIHS